MFTEATSTEKVSVKMTELQSLNNTLNNYLENLEGLNNRISNKIDALFGPSPEEDDPGELIREGSPGDVYILQITVDKLGNAINRLQNQFERLETL